MAKALCCTICRQDNGYGCKDSSPRFIYAKRQNVGILEALDTLTDKYNNSQLWNHLPEGPEKEQLLAALHERGKEFDEDTMLVESLRRAVEDNRINIISSIEFISKSLGQRPT